MRAAGIMLPVFAATRQGDLGIGDTLALRSWIDWAADCGVGIIQILPINESSARDISPFSAISSIALEPLYLAFDPPQVPLLHAEDIAAARGELGPSASGALIDYEAVRKCKTKLLRIAYERFRQLQPSDPLQRRYALFLSQNADWLEDYCVFQQLSAAFPDGPNWQQWPLELHDPSAARHYARAHFGAADKSFYAYVQWLCFEQWHSLAAYARARGVQLMGDIPIGVALHSADVFFHRADFHTDWFIGTPPEFGHVDPFLSRWGQNWGLPVYRWDHMHHSGYAWWRRRLRHLGCLFDLLRLDHIVGFYRIYAFPWHPSDNARFTGLVDAQAAELTGGCLPRWWLRADDNQENMAHNRHEGDIRLRSILAAAPSIQYIAEDLGWVPEYVRPHLAELGICRYRIPHWESYGDGSAIPGECFEECSLATYSTHDHEPLNLVWANCCQFIARVRDGTIAAEPWQLEGANRCLRLLAQFAGIPIPAPGQPWPSYSQAVHLRLLKALLGSHSRYAMLPLTDLFMLPTRINHAGVNHPENWRCRFWIDANSLAQTGHVLRNLLAMTRRSKLVFSPRESSSIEPAISHK